MRLGDVYVRELLLDGRLDPADKVFGSLGPLHMKAFFTLRAGHFRGTLDG